MVRSRWWFPGLVVGIQREVGGGRASGVRVLPLQEHAHHVDAGLGAENASPPGVGGEIVNQSLEGDVGESRILEAQPHDTVLAIRGPVDGGHALDGLSHAGHITPGRRFEPRKNVFLGEGETRGDEKELLCFDVARLWKIQIRLLHEKGNDKDARPERYEETALGTRGECERNEGNQNAAHSPCKAGEATLREGGVPGEQQLGDRAFLLARRGGSDSRRAAGCACVGNGSWNEDDEENADDSKAATQAEGGGTERDECDEDKCCRDTDGVEARGDDPCSSHDGVGLCWGEGAADERQGEHTPSLPSGCR